jgi:tetratricopeptide (TPR) repeat protein
VFYECVVGTSPFHRSSDVAVLNAHLHAPPPKLSKAAPDLPPALEPILAKALSKSPLDRYASSGEFAAAARAAAAPPSRAARGRLLVTLGLLALAALAGAAVAVGVDRIVFPAGAKHDLELRTTTVTVTPPPGPAPLDRLLLKSTDGRTLNDAAFALITADEYQRALPFARKAMKDAKKGTLTRGYATFNVGYALYKLGECRQGLPYLRKALHLQPPRNGVYIRERITAAQNCAQGRASGPPQSPSSAAASGPSRGK